MTGVFAIISIIAAIAATVLAFIFIVPDNKRSKLNRFGKLLHDICNFKFLVIEKVLQCFYILATSYTIIFGFFNIFNFQTYKRYNWSTDSYRTHTEWYGYIGLLMMILGPIVIRITYEILLLGILKLKNVIQINNKLKNQNGGNVKDAFAVPDFKEYIPEKNNTPNPNYNPNYNNPQYYNPPVYNQSPVQNKFCVKCGSVLAPDGTCPNCH